MGHRLEAVAGLEHEVLRHGPALRGVELLRNPAVGAPYTLAILVNQPVCSRRGILPMLLRGCA
jgi:hypothetical protein